jgi:uncharacterized metal-binding protein YceD (DUF177 family)
MDEKFQDIVIPIKGLPLGESTFRFEIGEPFFQAFENGQIKDADCSVKVSVMRHQTLLDIVCEIGGFVVVECDRCLEDLTLKVDIAPHLTVGFGTVDVDDLGAEDDVQVVDHAESELNLNQFVYDYICLGLPLVKVHPEGKCNPEMLRYISENEGTDTAEEGELSRPFESLKELLKNKNN